jgi:hypothetical protein
MNRRPDVLCTGDCGRLLWSGSTSASAEVRLCQPCRRRRAERACEHCGQAYRPHRPSQRTCSPRCGRLAYIARLSGSRQSTVDDPGALTGSECGGGGFRGGDAA